ncbi:MAG: tRNA (cytidine(34)-2'-O)-methyltransferase [Alphaproteobacteria bacterium]
MKIALYQPDIPQNLGAMMRLCACMGTGLDIIEPCGFIWNERKIRQSAMDYFDKINIMRHNNQNKFFDSYQGQSRIILMTTKTDTPYYDFDFRDSDIILAGRESSGVPQDVHERVDSRICIPMTGDFRSLNIVNATSMILGEAIRQTRVI